MSVLSKPYTFVAGETIKAAEVNASIDAIVNFLNQQVAHVDGSKAFTGLPLLPAVDPTNASHPARKSYVDALVDFYSPNYALAADRKSFTYAGNGISTVTVAFPFSFGSIPRVTLALEVGSNHDLACNIQSITPSGMTVRTFQPRQAAVAGSGFLHYIAVASNA